MKSPRLSKHHSEEIKSPHQQNGKPTYEFKDYLSDNEIQPRNLSQSDYIPGPSSKQKVNVSFMSRLKNWGTNLNFKLDNTPYIVGGQAPIRILGKVYSPLQREEVNRLIDEILWFSYREKIPSLLKDVFPDKNHTSDRGWGCMLRCGQMMVAEVIKRFFVQKGILLNDHTKEDLRVIISYFLDSINEGELCPFSIQQISRIAYDQFNLKPGEWYKASNIIVALDRLHKKYPVTNLKKLRFVTFVDGTIFEDQIYKEAIEGYAEALEAHDNKRKQDAQEKKQKENEAEKKSEDKVEDATEEKKEDHHEPNEEHKDEENVPNNEGEKNSSLPDLEEMEKRKWDNSIFLFVASKTGLEEHNYDYLPTLFSMMAYPQSVGMLGGKGSRAYYFLGFQNAELLYFDPHYVQDTVSNPMELTEKMHTYFTNKCFQIDIRDIDTSVGLGFYISNEAEYQDFKARIQNSIKKDSNFLIGFEKETPSLDMDDGDVLEIKSNDDSFEIIA